MVSRLAMSALAIALALMTTSCSSGGSKPRITGKVMMDGSPLTDAELSFTKQQKGGGSKLMARTDSEGKYQVIIYGTQPIEPGTYRVSIDKWVDKKGQVTDPGELTQLKMAGMAKNLVPAPYNDPDLSPLKAELKPESMEVPTFDIKTTGK
jgi:hypothetical protein